MPINFDTLIKDRVVYYDPSFTINDIISKLVNEEWEIIAFRDSVTIEKNNVVPLLYRDVVTNIRSNDSLLYYVIDGIDYPVRDDTRIITSLTPFKIIYIKVISDKKRVDVTFTRLFISNNIINELRKEIVYDNNFTYHGGELI